MLATPISRLQVCYIFAFRGVLILPVGRLLMLEFIELLPILPVLLMLLFMLVFIFPELMLLFIEDVFEFVIMFEFVVTFELIIFELRTFEFVFDISEHPIAPAAAKPRIAVITILFIFFNSSQRKFCWQKRLMKRQAQCRA